MFDARLLSVFREVATRGSFSDAATALSFTQPAISQQIARLERQLDTRLLVRDGRGVTLTPAGEVLLRHAETVLAQLRLAEAEVLAATGVERPAPARRRLSRAPAGEHHAAGAGRAARLASEDRRRDARRRGRRGARRPAAGELDVAMVLDSELMPLELPAGLEAVARARRPAAHRAALQPPARGLVARSRWPTCATTSGWCAAVGGTCIDSNVVLRACDAPGFEPRITFETEDYSAIMGMVASGMGVALIPSLALVSAREDIAIRPLRDARPVRRVRAAVAVERPSALADALLETLRAAGRERPWAGRQRALAAA
jgi:DNA-binding transcriptional LysR family regulator